MNSAALAENPVKLIKILGESLVLFRDRQGRLGLIGDTCPHRRISLLYGIPEEEGLRCPYHGWKFDVSGRCVDMPNEAPGCDFKDKVHLQAYPCQERNGVVWAYLGPRSVPPPLPDFEWNLAPDNIPYLWRNYRACNWVQCLEGDIDSSHLNYLHRTFDAPVITN